MNSEKRLYQLVIGRLDGDRIHQGPYARSLHDLARKGIGGFIVFGGRRPDIGDFISELQSLSDVPLFIASDIERGVGQQIKGAGPLPCPMAVAAALDSGNPADSALLENALKGVADEAIDNRINMPLIPVMDVNRDPDNPIICTRSFSDAPETVAWFGSEYIRTLERAGLLTCAKHFPGHGDTSVDSHIALPVIRKTKEALRSTDLFPFVRAIEAGVSSIMIGHLAVPALDDMPATLSRKIMIGLLREELGFRGLILTDALDMRAMSDIPDLPVKCLSSGADILLHPADVDASVSILRSAFVSGALGESIIDGAVGRIMKEKERLGRLTRGEVAYGRDRCLSADIADRSITLVKYAPGLLPLSVEKPFRLIVAGDAALSSGSALERLAPPQPLTAYADMDVVGDELLIFAIFTAVAAWKGSSGIAPEDRESIAGLIGKAKKAIVISFGSPYVLRYFGKADILIAAYEPTPWAQEAVMKCLCGEIDFRGHLPVKLNMEIRFDKEVKTKYSPRFGKIAVDMGFITAEQLKLALASQVDDEVSGNPHRVIGSIFFERGWMTYQEIEQVLKELFKESNHV